MTSPTSSPASADGTTLSLWPDGHPMAESGGPAPAPASRSAPRGNGKPTMTHGISGRAGFGSSASAVLSECLGSRLRAQLGSGGSTWFRQTWKQKATPLGRLYWAHTASARPTDGNGSGSWRTPNATDGDHGGPNARDRTGGLHLTAQAVATWPTATVDDANNGTRASGDYQSLTRTALLASWATPNAPMQHDSDHSAFRWNPNKKQDDVVMQLLGRDSPLSDVPMANRGQLNPRFSLWLMGYPTVWASCGERATPSSRKSRRRS